METFDFPQSLLGEASKITLAELLDCPLFQPWVVSMMANSVNCSHHFETTKADDVLEYRVAKVLKTIPYEERTNLFSMCAFMVRERQTNRPKKQSAAQ
jgi:hypothetical protein